jgi:hypothetical protein
MKNAQLKVLPGFPNAMPVPHAERINRNLLSINS